MTYYCVYTYVRVSLPAVPFERQLFVPCIDTVGSFGRARSREGVGWEWLAKSLTKRMALGLVHPVLVDAPPHG